MNNNDGKMQARVRHSFRCWAAVVHSQFTYLFHMLYLCLLVLGERGEKLDKVLVLLLCCLLGEAKFSRDAWQVHLDPIALEPVILALCWLEETSSFIISIPFHYPATIGDKEGQLLLCGGPPGKEVLCRWLASSTSKSAIPG